MLKIKFWVALPPKSLTVCVANTNPNTLRTLHTGDYIIVINADKLRVTGNKALDKKYYRHSGYPGGHLRTQLHRNAREISERVLEKAVKGMLPKGPLGYAMIKKLKVYAGAEHGHAAQQPKVLEISRTQHER